MKRIILLSLILLSTTTALFAEEVLRGADAHDKIPGAEVIRLVESSNIPAYIQFRQDSRLRFEQWQSWMKNRFFKHANGAGFILLEAETDKMGMVHYRYQQTFGSYPLTFGIWMVHTLNGEVVSMNGYLFDELPATTSPALTEAEALNLALQSINAQSYLWQSEDDEAAIKEMKNDPAASYFPQGSLEFINGDVGMKETELKLAWKFRVYAHEPLSHREIYIDAIQGDVVFENNLIHHTDSNGVATTGYSGQQDIVTDFTGSQFRLRESGRGDGILTFNMNGGTSGSGSDFFHSDNDWDTTSIQRFGTDAHWGAEKTYDFFFNHFGRNSIDNQGFTLRSRVHYGNNFGNAFWDGYQMTYGDGSSGNAPFTALDIAGHEIAHGLTTFTANLVYQSEPGALNESFSDIFGASIEFDALGFGNGDWLMGEDLGFIIRNMANPNLSGDPDTYFGTYWASLTGGDNGGVHTNSGVQNYWFYLLTVGGSGTNDLNDAYSVSGIGLSDAAAIAYRNLTTYLTVSSQYTDARFYAIQSAIDLFGACSPQVESTWDAWYAVGLGTPYTGEVIADFEADIVEHCSIPATVQFTNLSSLGSNFTWNFGDGNTSNAVSPSHTYTAAGEYTVSLTTTSSCGADSTIKLEYIKLGSAYPCQVIMPSGGGLASTQTGCEGYLYDDGGPTGAYSPNYDATITIAPAGGVSVTLEAIAFNVENDPNCIYDYLIVYDGASTASTVMGTYCDANPLPAMLTSTGPAITLQFHTDEGLEEQGFQIYWKCNVPSESPLADFASDKVETCKGEVTFFDESALGAKTPTSWFWDFGDGNTDTLQNPQHTYQSSGTYTVTMVAMNAFGSDTVVKANYILVDMPDAPTGDDDDVCPGDQGMLVASGDGDKYWYDAPFGGNLLHVGDTFTTPVVQQSTAFYVESVIPGPLQSTGATDNQIGSGTYFNNYQSLFFNALNDFVLRSVKVYTSLPGNRNILIYDNNQNVVYDSVIYIATGEQTVDLDAEIPAGNAYSITAGQGYLVNMFRNNEGVSYPYEIPGLVSVYTSSAGDDFYYFFYDWKVQDECVSSRTSIAASTGICTGIDEFENDRNYTIYPNPTRGQATLQWTSGENPGNIQVYSTDGRLLLSLDASRYKERVNIDMEHLSSGMYLIRNVHGTIMISDRIIKE